MKEIITFMLGVIVCGGVFTAFYALALHRRVSFRTARVFLMAGVVLSAVIPAFDIPVWKSAPVEIPVMPMDISMYREPAAAVPEARRQIDYKRAAVTAVYVLGAAGMLAAMAFQFARIGRIRRRSQISRADGYRIAVSDDVDSPFSFLSTVFVGRGISPTELRQILLHEASHIRHRHTTEKIIMELLKTVLWFNPFAWVASRWLNEVHEFEADRDALRDGCTMDEYLPLIFRQVFGYAPEISTGLGNSLTKKRFEMMTKNFKHRRYSWLRTAGVLPAAVGLLMLFGFTHRAPEIVFTEPEQAAEQKPEQTAGQEQHVDDGLRMDHFQPEFPGGMKVFIKWLIDEIGDLSTETSGKEKDVKMELRFTVMVDGSLDSIKVVNSPDKALSDKVVSALKKSPRWEPGIIKGRPVTVSYTLPVTIRMDKPAGGTAPKNDTVSPQAGAAKPEPEVIEEKTDVQAGEFITMRKNGDNYEVTETVRNVSPMTVLSANTLQDSTLKFRMNSGGKGAPPFVWLENEGREIESLDGIPADQVETIAIMKNPSDYPQDIIDAMGEREFNGVIIIKMKEPDEPVKVTVVNQNAKSKSYSGGGVTISNEEKKLRHVTIDKSSDDKDMVTVTVNSSQDSIRIKGVASADRKPFIWVSGNNPYELSGGDLNSLDLNPEKVLSVSVLKERPYPKEIRKALKNKDVEGVIIVDLKE